MPTLLRDGAFRVVVFVNDHPPPHVHVFGDGHAKIVLVGPGGDPVVVLADGMTRADIRKALAVVRENRDMLLVRWSELHD